MAVSTEAMTSQWARISSADFYTSRLHQLLIRSGCFVRQRPILILQDAHDHQMVPLLNHVSPLPERPFFPEPALLVAPDRSLVGVKHLEAHAMQSHFIEADFEKELDGLGSHTL